MKFTKPIYNHIRLDTDHSFLKPNDKKVEGANEVKVSAGKTDSNIYYIEFRLRIILHDGVLVNEIVGYTGESQSTILSHSDKVSDKINIQQLLLDMFYAMRKDVSDKLPAFDFRCVPHPNYDEYSTKLILGLEKGGLYKS